MTVEPSQEPQIAAPGATEPPPAPDFLPASPAPSPEVTEALRAENLALASRLRDALLASDPAIAPELVSGGTVAEIEASYAAAKAFADRVRESLRRESAVASSVPAGAPGRSLTPVLNPREKIRAGLSRPAGQPAPAP